MISSHTAGSPHVRGDGAPSCPALVLDPGSPPRAWGRLPSEADTIRAVRFTPTCVGTASGGRES